MTLRRHQSAMLALAERIAAGEPITEIFASVTPGGGKSALPPILADVLIGSGFDAIVWVVPRSSLRSQGEGDYAQWSRRTRIRAAGNEGDPLRGYDGYVTTYQAIIADPELHRRALRWRRYILFLDENHHVSDNGAWDAAIRPLIEGAGLVVYASGTFARGDGQRITGLTYTADGLPDFSARPGAASISYTRTDALREGAIVPVYFKYLDGSAEWEKDGEIHSSDSLNCGDDSGDALFTVLRTDYALQLLDATVAAWRESRASVYPAGKLLIVAPNISLAGIYHDHLRRRHVDSLIATSDDSPAAAQAIARFKGQALPSADVLVCVGMCYEGLSVPAVSHIACLTHIRSIPWLEQCFARANRVAPGKVGGFVYGPNDPRFREAIRAIEEEQALALHEGEDRGGEDEEESEDGPTGQGRQRVQPLHSEVIGGAGPLFDVADVQILAQNVNASRDGGLAPSQAEKLLRHQIAQHIEIIVGKKRPGSRAAMETILMRKLKDLVGGKGRAELTVEELTVQWAWLKENYPL